MTIVVAEKGKTMARLIDADLTEVKLRQRLIETAINNVGVKTDADYLYKEVAENRLKNWLDEVPTIEAITVEQYTKTINDMVHEFATIEPKRGRWSTWDGGIKCSLCGAEYETETTNYCPNCGARMDGGEE